MAGLRVCPRKLVSRRTFGRSWAACRSRSFGRCSCRRSTATRISSVMCVLWRRALARWPHSIKNDGHLPLKITHETQAQRGPRPGPLVSGRRPPNGAAHRRTSTRSAQRPRSDGQRVRGTTGHRTRFHDLLHDRGLQLHTTPVPARILTTDPSYQGVKRYSERGNDPVWLTLQEHLGAAPRLRRGAGLGARH